MEGQEPGRGARRPLRLVAGLFVLLAAGASAWVLPAPQQAAGARGAASSAAGAARRGGGGGGAVAAFIHPAAPFARGSSSSHSRREAVVMGLFGGGKAPEPAPAPAKKGLFGGLLGSKNAAPPPQQQQQQGAGGKKRKLVKKRVKSSATKTNTKAQEQQQQKKKAEEKKKDVSSSSSRFQRQTLQRDDSWDLIEKERVPLSSIAAGAGGAAVVGGYFFRRYWTKRNEKLATEFVDDMMAAGMDTRELYRVSVSYKSKLGPFATARILGDYLKAVFRAPDLSSSFVEAMDTVVNQLLKVKDQELIDIIADIAREMAKGQEFVGMSILLFTFERILPEDLARTQLEPLRRALGKALPGDVASNMFELAKDAYALEVEACFTRGESPLVAPEGYQVLGLHEDDAEQVFRRVKRSYEGEGPTGAGGAVGEDGEDLGQSLIVRRKEPLHDMIYGKAEDIADKYIVGYKEEKERKKAEKARGRPPTWDETVQRISQMVLSKEGEAVIESLQKFQCLRCQRLTTLMPGQLEDEVFHPEYTCPQCGSGRDMVIRKS